MSPRQILRLKKRITVLNKLIQSFKSCRKLIRRYCAELIEKEARLCRTTEFAEFKVAANGQLCLF